MPRFVASSAPSTSVRVAPSSYWMQQSMCVCVCEREEVSKKVNTKNKRVQVRSIYANVNKYRMG